MSHLFFLCNFPQWLQIVAKVEITQGVKWVMKGALTYSTAQQRCHTGPHEGPSEPFLPLAKRQMAVSLLSSVVP